MKTKIIEATNGFNWGKFLLGRLDHEWQIPSAVLPDRPLLRTIGWSEDFDQLWVLDLQTGEGAYFRLGGLASHDLRKRRIWVCPLFEPFLEWLYDTAMGSAGKLEIETLPALVELPTAPSAIDGYRRTGLASPG